MQWSNLSEVSRLNVEFLGQVLTFNERDVELCRRHFV